MSINFFNKEIQMIEALQNGYEIMIPKSIWDEKFSNNVKVFYMRLITLDPDIKYNLEEFYKTDTLSYFYNKATIKKYVDILVRDGWLGIVDGFYVLYTKPRRKNDSKQDS